MHLRATQDWRLDTVIGHRWSLSRMLLIWTFWIEIDAFTFFILDCTSLFFLRKWYLEGLEVLLHTWFIEFDNAIYRRVLSWNEQTLGSVNFSIHLSFCWVKFLIYWVFSLQITIFRTSYFIWNFDLIELVGFKLLITIVDIHHVTFRIVDAELIVRLVRCLAAIVSTRSEFFLDHF